MFSLPRHFRQLNARYHGEEGDRFAIDELNPVVRRFASDESSVLEVGCGYGRNLVALSRMRLRRIVGCDVAFDELVRARHRLRGGTWTDVNLVRQEPFRLPFRDQTFDVVILWQVLEHLFGPTAKQQVIDRISGMGTNLLLVRPGAPNRAGMGGSIATMTPQDAEAIAALPNVLAAVPELGGNVTLRYGNTDYQTQATATSAAFPLARCNKAKPSANKAR